MTKNQNIDFLGKVPPQDVVLEEIVLSGLMSIGGDFLEELDEVVNFLTIDCFYKPDHQIIFKAIKGVYSKGITVDLLSLYTFATENNLGFTVSELSNLMAKTGYVSHHNLMDSSKRLKDLGMLRLAINTSHKLMSLAFDNDVDSTWSLLSKISDDANNYMFDGINDTCNWQSQIQSALKELSQRQNKLKEGTIVGTKTPLSELDSKLGGWQPSDLIIIAARPSMGKTAFALMSMLSASQYGDNVCLFSLEMSRFQLFNRFFMGYTGGIDPSRTELKREEWELLESGIAELESFNCNIEDRSPMTVEDICVISRKKKREGRCDLIIVDYLQLMKDSIKDANKDVNMGHKSSMLKSLAKELEVPVIALSQLNRGVESRGDKRPVLSDLRESGNIEQDADIVGFLYRDAYYGNETMQTKYGVMPTEGIGELIIRKNRNGTIGTVLFSHNKELTRFSDFNNFNI